MSLFWITLFILIFPQKGKLDLSPVNPILEICDNGVPDVVVTLTNGTHCLLKGQHLFEIDVHRENASHVFRMNEKFGDRIDGYVDLAFTMSGVSWSEANDRTIMVKGNRYFVYHNYEYVTDDYTKHWFETKKGVSPNEAFYDQVIHQKEDAVISFRHRKMLHQYETAMLFDDHRRPERVNVYRVASALHPSVLSIMDSSQAYYFVPSIGDTFHLYFQSGDEGFFCFLPAFNSRCSPKKVTSMFQCPVELEAVRKKNFLGAITSRYRITTADLMLCTLGFAIGVTLTFISLLLALVLKYRSVRKVLEDLIALQDEEQE